MGNGIGKLNLCFSGPAGEISRRHDITVYLSDPFDEGLGHSFCYIRPELSRLSFSKVHSDDYATTFRTISGASISANTSTPLSTALIDLCPYNNGVDKASAFESSDCFAAIPLQPIPRNSIKSIHSGPIPRYSGVVPGSGPIERGFLSGPIERSFISGPLENQYDHDQLQRYRPKTKKWALIKNLKKAIAKSIVVPIRGAKEFDWANGLEKNNDLFTVSRHNSNNFSGQVSLGDDDELLDNQNLQWAQGKAGEDRVHIVISEEHGWVFVGIYDGFNGPDATDFLLNNLYSNIQKELKGLLWNEKFESMANSTVTEPGLATDLSSEKEASCAKGDSNLDYDSKRKRCSRRGAAKKWEENQWRWKCEWDTERVELDRKLKEQLNNLSSDGAAGANRSEVLKALSEGLRKTEESFLEIADTMLMENPELSLMGSCVLVMLMKGEDVYLLNVGDSRAVLARKPEPDLRIGKACQDLERINEETLNDLEAFDDEFDSLLHLTSLQLTIDHSTSVKEEIRRIKSEHRDDPFCCNK
ncbi:hypothetical protein F0562_016724 [Nyssa sinensis]|uniref:PPM-type phosphatase domain-containing protein n=1 Tax=Nyssa sinensis TaxID=561372 RepID=A0A5J4ZGH0_9ASTE|nr:hypothetical protein F0562_016724 [Nyssa sinensis]